VWHCPGESLCSFIQRFSQVHNTIPRISNAIVVVAFRQAVRDEKMLEKLATHDIHDVTELFSLEDKCPLALEVEKPGKPNVGVAAQGGGSNSSSSNNNNNNKKAGSNNQPLASAPTTTATATTAGGGRGL
jgi:hypothetical protein